MTCREIAELEALYLSGELAGNDPARAEQFAAHLASCESCTRDLERQAGLDRMLREGVRAETIDGGFEQRLRASLRAKRPSPARTWFAAAAAVAAIVIMGVAGSRILLMQPATPLCTDAAADHRTEVVNRQIRAWRTSAAELEVLADRPGVDVPPAAPPGFHLDRGKLCRLEGQVYLHLVYSNGAQEFSLYLRHRGAELPPGKAKETANGRPIYSVDRGHEHIAFLQTDRVTAVIVTDQSSRAALALARFEASTL